MNNINKYNSEMGGVFIADNHRKYYRVYFGVSNRKWWWYIFAWSVFVILTNAYIIYMCIHYMQGTPSKHRLSRCDFIKSIACAWINLEINSAEEFEFQS